ncbi:thiamine-phosphate kinase [Hoyosella rhizosphaerae]|uniref:thiamine-phosphate kinase n=1 Tax=Hoyosella rhizosphaerae TaxID=1755582 RepID=UPI00166B5B55|nr:thiamine-phosphate kinase [Hoyosella rhizosphaerae]MBN4927322.1 thiamine-phosphate kinase [Hoyosella rhizosphaerae]
MTTDRSDLPNVSDATVSEIGEFSVIARATDQRQQPADVQVGPGDDAAVVTIDGAAVVACVDTLVEGRHFRVDWSTGSDIGRKAIAQNAADLAAMGAIPVTFLVSLGCPADTSVAFTDDLVAGLWAEAARFGAGISGGDLVQSDQITVSVTALGSLQGRTAVLRSGAQPGDVVAVAGELGKSAAGLHLLANMNSDSLAPFVDCVHVHRVPDPPYTAGIAAANAGAHSMIDTSDGLLADLSHVAAASQVRVDIETALLPIPSAVAEVAEMAGVDPLDWVLGGGEDHALVATFASHQTVPAPFRRVGSVSAGSGVTVDGARVEQRGWTSWRRTE